MGRQPLLLLCLLTAAVLLAGCSGDDNPVAPADDARHLSAVLRGEIDGNLVDFEIAAKVGAGGGDPAPGSLLVRGRNLAYDDAEGVLTVDLSLVNDGDLAFPEPVSLTFVQLLPADVTLRGADNGETGPGASFAFEFENDDAVWTPGEESLPRTMMFEVAAGTSIGFVARVDVDTPDPGGAIGGLVWHDADEDGEIDDGEEGVGGVSLALFIPEGYGAEQTATTAEDGTFRFDGLTAGYYTVARLPREGLTGTTPSEIAVLLVEADGEVVDFMMANFGVVPGDDPAPLEPRVGDYVVAKGEHVTDPHRLVPEIFTVCPCDGADLDKHDGEDDDCEDCDDGEDSGDCEEDCDDGCRENACWGLLAGPVTGIDREAGYVEIMGTPVHVHEKCDWDELEREPRLRVKAYLDDEGDVVACGRFKWWNGHRDRVRGFVQEVVRGDDDTILGVVVLNTYVELAAAPETPPAGSIGGVVFDDLNGDGERGTDEPGLPGVNVSLTGPGAGSIATDEDGAYLFTGLAMGAYMVACGPVEGYAPTTADEVPVTLADDEQVTGIDFGWVIAPLEPR